ncbi:hypothetical protein JYY74_004306 [Salmonella enterica subsp. enterica serovar Enteritidis]|nr:hypothetical protein [Salmonella enterica subsp. enterica serovar Enteritidis]
MINQPYVCTDPEIIALREKMAALMKKHDLPEFDFNVKAQIPTRGVLLKACESLDKILNELIANTDIKAKSSFCAKVSSYANKIDYCLTYYHRMSPPLSVAYRPMQFRIAWYAEQSKNSVVSV